MTDGAVDLARFRRLGEEVSACDFVHTSRAFAAVIGDIERSLRLSSERLNGTA